MINYINPVSNNTPQSDPNQWLTNSKDKIKYSYNILREEGLSEKEAIAVLGNIAQESKFDHTVKSNSGYRGLVQLSGPRYNHYQSYLKINKLPDSMENQVRYIARTIVNPDLAQKHWSTMKGLSIFRNNPTVKNFATFYEGTNNALDKRSNYSNIINTMRTTDNWDEPEKTTIDLPQQLIQQPDKTRVSTPMINNNNNNLIDFINQ